MDNFVFQGHIDDSDLKHIRRILKNNKYRRQLRPSRVYYPKKGEYGLSNNRHSSKATFNNTRIKELIRPYLPYDIELPLDHHIDLGHYKTGDYFNEHRDFVATYPNNGFQVSIIIGLLTTKSGCTCIRIDDTQKEYNESITSGGLLIFNSRLLHSGERVIGEKEILVLTGYMFNKLTKVPSLSPLVSSDNMRCIFVYTTTIYYDNNDNNDDYVSVILYMYINNRLVIISKGYYIEYDGDHHLTSTKRCVDQQEIISNFNQEQLDVMKGKYSSIKTNEYPLMNKILTNKGVMKLFGWIPTINQGDSKTSYSYEDEDEFCNGGDDYRSYSTTRQVADTRQVAEMTELTSCRMCSIAMYNRKYYTFWLNQINKLPEHLYNQINIFLDV